MASEQRRDGEDMENKKMKDTFVDSQDDAVLYDSAGLGRADETI